MIKKINPTEDIALKAIYTLLMTSCFEGYSDLKFDDVLKSRDSIYVYTSRKDGTNFWNDVFPMVMVSDVLYKLNELGLIGCHREYMENIGLKDLPYHCQPHDVIYNINMIHCFAQENAEEILKWLINECLADKNDAFCVIKGSICQDITKSLLIKCGFEDYEDSDGIVYYLRKPVTQ